MMVSGLLARVPRLWVTLGYTAVVSVIAVAVLRMDPDAHDALIRHASTNLHNLSRGRWGTLFGSAFVVDAESIYLWLPGLVCLLAVAELVWGSGRLLLTFITGHIGATLLVAVGLFIAVRFGWMSRSVAHASDVGMSYGAMAVLGSLTAAIPPRWRPLWVGWWVAVSAVVVAGSEGFTDTGHVVSLTLGMAVSTRFGVRHRWTVPTVVLLVPAASFGFLVLAEGVVSMIFGAAWGTLGALTFEAFARLRATALLALPDDKGRPAQGAPCDVGSIEPSRRRSGR